MNINQRLENIFAHAVALQQSGRLRSTVYCLGKKIYILNQDSTVLLQFLLREKEIEFKSPVSFVANDYDSQEVEERDGKICFVTSAAGFERTKSCRTPAHSPKKIDSIWEGYELEETNRVSLHRDVLSLLDESLSHIEFSCTDGELKIAQRNIYSGAVIELERKEPEGLGAKTEEELEDFNPIGMRTNDFGALFSFTDNINLYFPEGGIVWMESQGKKLSMRGLISKCRYDELGGTTDGRKE